LDEAAGALKDLGRQFAAVFARHRAFDALDDVRGGRTVVLELLGAVVDGDPGALADVFIVAAFVGVLKTTPAADVVGEDALEVGLPVSTSAIICRRLSRPSDVEAALAGILEDSVVPGLGVRSPCFPRGRRIP
jgi:hypothetical protein